MALPFASFPLYALHQVCNKKSFPMPNRKMMIGGINVGFSGNLNLAGKKVREPGSLILGPMVLCYRHLRHWANRRNDQLHGWPLRLEKQDT